MSKTKTKIEELSDKELHNLIQVISDKMIEGSVNEFFDIQVNRSDTDIKEIKIRKFRMPKDGDCLSGMMEKIVFQVMHLLAAKICAKNKKYQQLFTQIFSSASDNSAELDTPYEVLSSRIKTKVMNLYIRVLCK
ncbi:hypothetical protein A2335_01855 [Candidatus Peregrinibacteria bacterium RIFOXYB2_FULL_32_7]|nr:MAG: hypothetical protein A2335_01855 [Candidatus Peregrinibacteria bacterium RIFOXYB2_FULL_32_7]